MEAAFEAACENGDIRGAVLVATSADGSFQYQKAFGQATPDRALSLDATFFLASCSKLITSIAALQCVERGQIRLDDEVAGILPELNDLDILRAFDGDSGRPVLESSKIAITLRHLLTHSSGLGYDLSAPLLTQWRAYHNQKTGIPVSNFTKAYSLPLLHEPGASWQYGTGLEWAGILIERLNSTRLQDYLHRHIWTPLGIENMTFHLDQRPDMEARLPHRSKRLPGGKIEWTEDRVIPDPIQDQLGGCGLYSSAQDFLKVMKSILANDGLLLQPETVTDMFRPQLSPRSKQHLSEIVRTERSTGFGLPQGTSVDHGLAGMLIMEDLHTGRKEGSMSWGGLPNLKWWIDRKTGICGFYASQLFPPGDPTSVKMYEKFQAEMYQQYSAR